MRIRLVKPNYRAMAEKVLAGEIRILVDLEVIAETVKLAKEKGVEIVFFRVENGQTIDISAEIMQNAIDSGIDLRG